MGTTTIINNKIKEASAEYALICEDLLLSKYESVEVNNNLFIKLPRNQISNNFVMTVNEAFANHYHLIISPDDIWLTLVQGLTDHIDLNSENLRKQFVSFDDKLTLIARRDDFVKGSANNDWKGVFAEFSDKISEHIGKKRDLIVSEFSTTGLVEKAASEIALMGTMKNYFSYEVHTLCGIPRITLLGTVDDWQSIRTRFSMFAEFDLKWWTDKVDPILEQFVNAKKGNVDLSFWDNIYKERDGSGGSSVNGWICNLFPYVFCDENLVKNKFNNRLSSSNFPNGYSEVPFIWDYFGNRIDMKFDSGFLGVTYDKNLNGVCAAIGYGIKGK